MHPAARSPDRARDRRKRAAATVLAVLALAPAAAAQPQLDPASFQALVGAEGEGTESVIGAPGAVSLEVAGFSGHAATTGGVLPTVRADCSTTGLVGSARADIYFQFAVEQLVPGDPVDVPVLVHTQGTISATHTGDGAALGSLLAGINFVGGNPYVEARACSPVTCAGDVENGFETTLAVSIPPWPGIGTVGVFFLDIDAGCFDGQGGSSSLVAWIDPIFEIDPAFARRDEFRLAFGAGVHPVPEPTAGSAALALALLGLARAHRRRT